MNKRQHFWLIIAFLIFVLLSGTSCRKSEYNEVHNPAYLRVFNTLSYKIDLSTKGKPVPFLTMIIDPTYDNEGIISGGTMVGDFLDTRTRYASLTSNASSTDYRNKEFPGKLKIPVAPIINGFDLSSWAQVPSGEHRFVFYTRPQNATSFFDLPAITRQQQILIADSVLNLAEKEVYTMNVLEKEVVSNGFSSLLYLRKEIFPKMAFADSLIYLNFYNLSAVGYVEAHPEASESIGYYNATGTAIKNIVNIYYSLFHDDVSYPYTPVNNEPPTIGNIPVSGFQMIPMQQLVRSHDPQVAPYNTIPLFNGSDTTGEIMSRNWINLQIIPLDGVGPPNFSPKNGTILSLTNQSDEGRIQNFKMGSFLLPSLIRQVASGKYLQRSFATISTIEFINKELYLTSVIKIYTPPGK